MADAYERGPWPGMPWVPCVLCWGRGGGSRWIRNWIKMRLRVLRVCGLFFGRESRGSGGGVRGAGAGGGPGTDGWVQMLRARSPPGGYGRLDGPRMGRLEGFRAPRGASSVKGEGEERFQIRVVMKR